MVDNNINKYKRCFKNLKVTNDVLEKVASTLSNKDLSWPFGVTKEFEEKICKFLKVKYALAHCNGTSAMYSAMFAAGVEKNTEVICPTYTFWASIAPAINLGAKVVFCDINKNDLLINVDNVDKFITNKTKAIVVPHLWGRLGNVDKLKKICNKYGHKIFIIEDTSHSFGATYKNKFLGTLGDIGIYSLQAGKTLTAGEGGLLVTNDFKIYDSSVYLGHYERIKFLTGTRYSEYSKTGGGYKFRIHPLAAALAISQLSLIKRKLHKLNMLMSYYESRLKQIPHVQTFEVPYEHFAYGGRFGLRVGVNINPEEKHKFIKECNLNGLQVEDEYLSLLHLEKFFMENNSQNIGIELFKETQILQKRLISLPIFYEGNNATIDAYIEDFKRILKRYTI